MTFKTISAAAASNPAPRLTLENAKVSLVYSLQDKQITAFDKTDANNEPACYSKNKRGIAKCWNALVEHFDAQCADMLNHRDVMNVMTEHGIRYHYWCRMD